MGNQFERTATQLSQGPLGIIALFIVLIHGFASLVLGLGADIGDDNKSILVWFLVLFPVLVFLGFTLLVSSYHRHLYPPQAFSDSRIFLEAALLDYPNATIDKQNLERRPSPDPHVLKTSAIGSLYWLAHDLMWVADVLLRKSPAEDARKGLEQARHHLAEVGLEDTAIDLEILSLHKIIKRSEEFSEELSSSDRDTFASKLGSIIDRLGMTAEAAQGDFRVPPHWARVRGGNPS
jgi:hypothetical protein